MLLDGFDLGVGILSLTSGSEERRGILMTSLGNVWDANETWLVLMGGSLFGAFPLAYATILNALYLPRRSHGGRPDFAGRIFRVSRKCRQQAGLEHHLWGG